MPAPTHTPQSLPPGYYLADWAQDLPIFVLVLARPAAAGPAQAAPASRTTG